MLFLHGVGERGANLELVKQHGPAKLVAAGKRFPFILVAPQCPGGVWWDNETLLALLDSVQKRYRVDPDRVNLTGLSMGGFGASMLAIHSPARCAALVPICGGGISQFGPRLKQLPVWAFDGARAAVVSIPHSQRMVNALKQSGGKVRLTVDPDAGHESRTATYANPALDRWLLKQRRRMISSVPARQAGCGKT